MGKSVFIAAGLRVVYVFKGSMSDTMVLETAWLTSVEGGRLAFEPDDALMFVVTLTPAPETVQRPRGWNLDLSKPALSEVSSLST